MQAQPPTWIAVIVKSRHEKAVKRCLEAKGYWTSVPLCRCWHTRFSGSNWQSEKPLIAGYVFVAYDASNGFHMVNTPGVVRILGLGATAGMIPYSEIEALERIAAAQLPVAHCQYTKIGERVRLVSGPLKGAEGLVVKQSGPMHFIVNVNLLQRSVAVEIENAWVVPENY